MYLEPIFASEDIKKKMQNEKQKFDRVDQHWREVMQILYKEPSVWDSIDSEKMKHDFQYHNKTLDQI